MAKLIIYSKDGCANCVSAIKIAHSKALDYTVLKLGVDCTKEDILEISNNTARTMPQFVYDGKYLGDYKAFCNWID